MFLGTPALEDKGTNEFFELAKSLLAKSVAAKNTDRVEIRER